MVEFPLNDFDFQVLNDPLFKEDAVREEILAPILKAIGYSVSGKNRIIRSKPLENPVSQFGITKRKVNIIPDYLLVSDNRYACVIDAKSPKEDIHDENHILQAYSYAIHPEIRVHLFGICNGRSISLFRTDSQDILRPILTLKIETFYKRENWASLVRYLRPKFIHALPSLEILNDLGVHLYMKINDPNKLITLQNCPIHKIYLTDAAKKVYSIASVIEVEQKEFMMHLICDEERLSQFLKSQNLELSTEIKNSLNNPPFNIELHNKPYFRMKAEIMFSPIGLQNTLDEVFLPFQVERFYI